MELDCDELSDKSDDFVEPIPSLRVTLLSVDDFTDLDVTVSSVFSADDVVDSDAGFASVSGLCTPSDVTRGMERPGTLGGGLTAPFVTAPPSPPTAACAAFAAAAPTAVPLQRERGEWHQELYIFTRQIHRPTALNFRLQT